MGSEMCIRDSARFDHRVSSGGHVVERLSVVGRVGQGEAVAGAGNCLLYTSDAADERSSVDLGGRRIIKKKKHER